ncbi:MAG TPA: carboxypeptidase-like regulatory domain-containing protein [Candidatus Paceibacterota bacterium]|nr:carboxypeptidase-like regulatory domain-containing protein [Verrucomicrobiota bacterium]HSA08941.1 carboxypeptidase-like regulatory domain-containing protein [Candidatus Paceibacterota bacterium]
MVLDESGQPVQGATVDFLWTHVHPEADFKTNTFSDARGLFSLVGVNGAGLDVYVRKPGYYAVRSLDRNNFNYLKLAGDQPFAPDPSNPVVFHLRKKGPGTALITSQNGMLPELEVTVPRNGVPVLVNLLSRKTGSEGQLQITQTKPQYLEAKNATAWSFQLQIPSGGLVEQNDEFPFDAPETGYQPVVAFQFNKGQTNWARTLKKSYYIAFGQPPQYGWLTVETAIGWGGARLRYAINPDGSRYLEPKN